MNIKWISKYEYQMWTGLGIEIRNFYGFQRVYTKLLHKLQILCKSKNKAKQP